MSMSMSMSINQMTSAVQQAIYENNEGTRLLRQCDYDAAVKSFTSVLQTYKPLAVIVEEKQHTVAACNNTRHRSSDHDCANTNASSSPFNISFNHTTPTDDDTYDESDSRIAHQVLTSLSPSRTSSSSQSSVNASSSLPPPSTTHEFPKQRKLKHFVFRDPVIILPHSIASLSATAAATATNINIEDPTSSFYSPALFSKFLIIVMYNLALTLHLQALSLVATSSTTLSVSSNYQHQTHKSNIKQLFKRSKKLYELAFELHLETDMDPLFTLALTNNLGLIYRTVNERKKSLICFRNMFSIMMYLMDSHNSHTNSQSAYEPSSSSIQSIIKNWDGLLSNAMDILFKHIYEVVAAAA